MDALGEDAEEEEDDEGGSILDVLMEGSDIEDDDEIDGSDPAVESILASEGEDVDVVLAAYEYEASPRDFERVQALARAGESIQSVVITSLAPPFFGCASWEELGRDDSPRALFAHEAYSAWRSLREKDESRWLLLVANRIAVRGRYASDEESTRGVRFTEPEPGGLLVSPPKAAERSWASTSATPRTQRSGPGSCARSSSEV